MKANLLTIGNDPEMLLRNRKTQEIVSAIPIIREGKENPRNLGKGFKVLHDNVLIEFNVPPADSKKAFVENLREGFKRIQKVIGPNYELVAQASYVYPNSQLKEKDALIFGCQPSFDAWKVEMNQPPDCNTNLRSAAAHIHIGRKDFENPDSEFLIDPYSKMDVIKLMDVHVGLILALIDQDPTSPARKKLYGRAGEHRPCEYGVEYRTPSNYWLRSPKLAELIYDLTEYTVMVAETGKTDEIIKSLGAEKIQKAINENDRTLARKLLTKVTFPDKLKDRIAQFEKPTEFVFDQEWGL